MHTINLFSKTVLSVSMLMMSAGAMAQNGANHHAEMAAAAAQPDQVQMMPDTAHAMMDHSQHHAAVPVQNQSQAQAEEQKPAAEHQGHDHRKEHGGQVYAVTSFDYKWLVNEDGDGVLKSELETRIGTDENKVFIKIHADQQESDAAEWDAKLLYSRMISDFWDAQIGARYRSEKMKLDHGQSDTEEYVDAVLGLHGMAPYFFETDAYLFAGADSYSGFSLETERDLLLTQKLIVQPYLNLDAVFSDESKYAKKTGLSHVTAGLETRYEISKKVMPYIDIAYAYDKGRDETAWQAATGSEHGWIYGAGIRFKF